MAEECLYLNVWAPPAGERPKPVIVFIHGGGFTIGTASAGISDGARLAAAADAVVVTINYRLGALGWLFHPELGGGNWGLRDQIAALEWVRENIARFGGDPGAVTLMGQSAGALSIVDLLAIDAADGLFARAILMSPPMHDALHEPELGIRWTEAMATALGGSVGALRDADPSALVQAHDQLLADPHWRGTRGGAMPIREAGFLDDVDPSARLGVDVMLGTTADEATFFTRARGAEADDEQIRAMTESMIVRPAHEWADAREAAGGRVFRYRVEHRSPQPRFGAIHTIDVPLVFGTFHDGEGRAMAGEATAVSKAMQAAVRAFAHGEQLGWDGTKVFA